MSRCVAPGCTDEAMYKEPAENGHFKVCKRHLEPTKDDVERL